jgi:hemolysin activation/secretion protein
MRLLTATTLVILTPLLAFAQAPAVPNAGTMLQQVQPVVPPVPPADAPELLIEKRHNDSLPPGTTFWVRAIRITGNTRFDTATLQPLVADANDQNLTLAQLEERAARLADYYRRRGYPLVQAIIPAQEIADGVVVIEIHEARYGTTRIDNRSAVRDSLLRATLSPLVGGQEINQDGLDHSLLLLSDIPGIAVNATLQPGETVGTADLLVSFPPAPAVSGTAMFDNYGNRYTGRERLGVTLNWNNPLHNGDVLSLSGLTSGRGLNYGRLAYESLLNGAGTRLGGAYSTLHYILGGPIESLEANGTAQEGSLWVRHPFMRTRSVNLYGQLQYDRRKLRDHIDTTAIQTDRQLDNWTASFSGDARDSLLGGGITLWRADWTTGSVDFSNTAAGFVDDVTAGTNGGFSKLTGNVVRLQRFDPKNSLYLSVTTQWADTNLDSSEKMIAGGPYSVRAYDIGAVSGDSGYLGSAEFRHELGAALRSQWQAVAFVETAHVTVNHTPWVTGQNDATLSGMGVGLNWGGPSHWNGKASIAVPIGGTPELVPDTSSSRFWIEISRGF